MNNERLDIWNDEDVILNFNDDNDSCNIIIENVTGPIEIIAHGGGVE